MKRKSGHDTSVQILPISKIAKRARTPARALSAVSIVDENNNVLDNGSATELTRNQRLQKSSAFALHQRENPPPRFVSSLLNCIYTLQSPNSIYPSPQLFHPFERPFTSVDIGLQPPPIWPIESPCVSLPQIDIFSLPNYPLIMLSHPVAEITMTRSPDAIGSPSSKTPKIIHSRSLRRPQLNRSFEDEFRGPQGFDAPAHQHVVSATFTSSDFDADNEGSAEEAEDMDVTIASSLNTELDELLPISNISNQDSHVFSTQRRILERKIASSCEYFNRVHPNSHIPNSVLGPILKDVLIDSEKDENYEHFGTSLVCILWINSSPTSSHSELSMATLGSKSNLLLLHPTGLLLHGLTLSIVPLSSLPTVHAKHPVSCRKSTFLPPITSLPFVREQVRAITLDSTIHNIQTSISPVLTTALTNLSPSFFVFTSTAHKLYIHRLSCQELKLEPIDSISFKAPFQLSVNYSACNAMSCECAVVDADAAIFVIKVASSLDASYAHPNFVQRTIRIPRATYFLERAIPRGVKICISFRNDHSILIAFLSTLVLVDLSDFNVTKKLRPSRTLHLPSLSAGSNNHRASPRHQYSRSDLETESYSDHLSFAHDMRSSKIYAMSTHPNHPYLCALVTTDYILVLDIRQPYRPLFEWLHSTPSTPPTYICLLPASDIELLTSTYSTQSKSFHSSYFLLTYHHTTAESTIYHFGFVASSASPSSSLTVNNPLVVFSSPQSPPTSFMPPIRIPSFSHLSYSSYSSSILHPTVPSLIGIGMSLHMFNLSPLRVFDHSNQSYVLRLLHLSSHGTLMLHTCVLKSTVDSSSSQNANSPYVKLPQAVEVLSKLSLNSPSFIHTDLQSPAWNTKTSQRVHKLQNFAPLFKHLYHGSPPIVTLHPSTFPSSSNKASASEPIGTHLAVNHITYSIHNVNIERIFRHSLNELQEFLTFPRSAWEITCWILDLQCLHQLATSSTNTASDSSLLASSSEYSSSQLLELSKSVFATLHEHVCPNNHVESVNSIHHRDNRFPQHTNTLDVNFRHYRLHSRSNSRLAAEYTQVVPITNRMFALQHCTCKAIASTCCAPICSSSYCQTLHSTMFYISPDNSPVFLNKALPFSEARIETPQVSSVDLSQDLSALMSLLSQPSLDSSQTSRGGSQSKAAASVTNWEQDKHAVSGVLTWMSEIWQCWDAQIKNGDDDAEIEKSAIQPIPGWAQITGNASVFEKKNDVHLLDDDIPEDSDYEDDMDDMFDDDD